MLSNTSRPVALIGGLLIATLLICCLALTGCGGKGSTTPVDAGSGPTRTAGGSEATTATDALPAPNVDSNQLCQHPTSTRGVSWCLDSPPPGFDPADMACPPARVARPAEGWLAEGGTGPTWSLNSYHRIDDPAAVQALADRVAPRLPRDFTRGGGQAYADCDTMAPAVAAFFTAPDGGVVTVLHTRLSGRLVWVDQPVSSPVRSTTGDGTEVVVDDFGHEGTAVRAWAARADGTYVKVSAFGPGASRQSGWPTTFYEPTSAPAVPAPLTPAQARALALGLLG